MQKTTIYLVRHGETEWNKKGILQGWLDSPLTQEGVTHARMLNQALHIKSIESVYSSDLNRAIQTATILAPSKSIIKDARLREIYLGEWQGQKISSLNSLPEYITYCNEPHLFQGATQERFEQISKRMMECIQNIHQHTTGNVLVVSHGVAILCCLMSILKTPIEKLWEIANLKGTSVTTLECINGHFNVKTIGEINHLNGK